MSNLVLIMVAVLGFVVGVPVSFLFQNQSLTLAGVPKAVGSTASTLPAETLQTLLATSHKGFSFGEYLASILPGDIFKSFDHAALVPTLAWTPVICGVIGIVLGALLHGFIFKGGSRPQAAV